MLLALMYIVLALVEWVRVMIDMKPQPAIFTLVALAVTGFAAYRFIRARPRMKALRQGQEGEKAVGQYLERLREDGFRVFHDVVGPGFNIDHVLIGPSGVYSIETKTWSKPARGQAEVEFDGTSVRLPNLPPDGAPAIQARAQARWLRALLADSTGRSLKVRPVILFPGWFIKATAGYQDLWVLEPQALRPFLQREESQLPAEDVNLVSYHLSRIIRLSERERQT